MASAGTAAAILKKQSEHGYVYENEKQREADAATKKKDEYGYDPELVHYVERQKQRELNLPLKNWLSDYVFENQTEDVDTCLAVLKHQGITSTAKLLIGHEIPVSWTLIFPIPAWKQAKVRCNKLFKDLGPGGYYALKRSRRTSATNKKLPVDGSSALVGFAYIAEVGTRNRLIAGIKTFYDLSESELFTPRPPAHRFRPFRTRQARELQRETATKASGLPVLVGVTTAPIGYTFGSKAFERGGAAESAADRKGTFESKAFEAALAHEHDEWVKVSKELEDPWAEYYPCPNGTCAGGLCPHLLAIHPPTNACPDQECVVCSVRDCPYGSEMHYDKDGCPSCGFGFHMVTKPVAGS